MMYLKGWVPSDSQPRKQRGTYSQEMFVNKSHVQFLVLWERNGFEHWETDFQNIYSNGPIYSDVRHINRFTISFSKLYDEVPTDSMQYERYMLCVIVPKRHNICCQRVSMSDILSIIQDVFSYNRNLSSQVMDNRHKGHI